MYNYIFRYAKRIIPNISKTERIALESGTTSIDRMIFSANVKLPNNYISSNNTKINEYKNKLRCIFNKYKRDKVFTKEYYNKNIVDDLTKDKFLSFIIPKKYGGEELSVREQSKILTFAASYNPSIAVTIMVPNSLGPGELLQHYGTEEQKIKYLPKLATGEYIPCFGLTGPNNGSDATGNMDTGRVIIENGKKMISVNLNKRYITLAPIANLFGVAFNLEGYGVTVALLEKEKYNIDNAYFHNPLDVGFPNGTLKANDLTISFDDIIGGEKMAGHGWKMLMDCLTVGRAISLPASALGAAKTATYGTLLYAQTRKQFKLPLMFMEGVREKIIENLYNTILISSGVNLTNFLLDQGEKPAVISAILKQQSTERSRIVINNAMDIYAGSGICDGENNFLMDLYKSVPIGITVEGSNTLTRSLIIFAQGLNKSHPYIYKILNSIENNNINDFKHNFNSALLLAGELYFSDKVSSYGKSQIENLEYNMIRFANVSNFMALLGGGLKKEQKLCGKMADCLSNIYLGHCIVWESDNYNFNKNIRNYILQRLNIEICNNLNYVIDNYPGIGKYMLSKNNIKNTTFKEDNDFLEYILHDKNMLKYISKDIYKDSIPMKYLKHHNEKVIQVGEYLHHCHK